MLTTRDLLAMCVNEYFAQLGKWFTWENLPISLYATVLAFEYIARGDY